MWRAITVITAAVVGLTFRENAAGSQRSFDYDDRVFHGPLLHAIRSHSATDEMGVSGVVVGAAELGWDTTDLSGDLRLRRHRPCAVTRGFEVPAQVSDEVMEGHTCTRHPWLDEPMLTPQQTIAVDRGSTDFDDEVACVACATERDHRAEPICGDLGYNRDIGINCEFILTHPREVLTWSEQLRNLSGLDGAADPAIPVTVEQVSAGAPTGVHQASRGLLDQSVLCTPAEPSASEPGEHARVRR